VAGAVGVRPRALESVEALAKITGDVRGSAGLLVLVDTIGGDQPSAPPIEQQLAGSMSPSATDADPAVSHRQKVQAIGALTSIRVHPGTRGVVSVAGHIAAVFYSTTLCPAGSTSQNPT
jgi:hypothetical protein